MGPRAPARLLPGLGFHSSDKEGGRLEFLPDAAGRAGAGGGPGAWGLGAGGVRALPLAPRWGSPGEKTHLGQASGLPRRPRGAREEKGWDEGRLAGLSLWLSGGQLPCPAWGGGTQREALAHHPSSESGRCHVLGARLPADHRGLQASEAHAHVRGSGDTFLTPLGSSASLRLSSL